MYSLFNFRYLLLISSIFLNAGCGSVKYSSVASGILNRNWTVNEESPAERAYCTTNFFYESSHSVSGKAVYEYRTISTELGEEGLREIAEDTKPIRHAQYDVTDASGTILQCGETDGDGNFSFTIPQNNRALSLNIYARSNSPSNRASVFIAPETNELHKVQYFFTANDNRFNVNIVAEGEDSLIGGAFNILDQIHNSFDFLYQHTNDGEGIEPEDIPKVDIYWEKGFNPGVYVGVDSGLSFFSKPQRKLFILGGENGDTDYSDTDHFDNSIIVHEYFHFLETAVSVSDSPGGAHDGNEILDPRLAWSEGAAQFFQAAVTGIPTVLDTRGNVDGNTGFYLKLSVENETTDIPIEEGEGEFREFAVARLLWDIHDTEDGESAPESFDNLNGYFSDFWRIFSGFTAGINFQNDKANFSSSGLLLEALTSTITGDSDWEDILSQNLMANDTDGFRKHYALPLESGAAAGDFNFTGPFFYNPNENLSMNHPVASMDSYGIQIPASTTQSFSFTHVDSTNAESGNPGALRMYVFEENYTNFTESIHGPLTSGTSVDLVGGPSGSTYYIVIVISTLPVKDPAQSNEVIMNYNFSGFRAGGSF